MTATALHHVLLPSEHAAADRCVLFLHGILGTGANLRPVAQSWVGNDPRYVAVLVDLRQHGRSQGRLPPHNIASAAADLVELENVLPHPVTAVVGHSFGGKVALQYHQQRPLLERVATLDSAPAARPERHGSEETLEVLNMLGRLPKQFARRDEFLALVSDQLHSRKLAEWLAMNLERHEDGFRLRLDLPTIHALLEDYFVRDLWPVLEQSSALIEVVIGDRSKVWSRAARARLLELEQSSLGRVRMHVLANADHWVHVDDLEGVRKALAPR